MPNPAGTKYTLERPRRRAQVIRLLADGNHPIGAIARYMGVSAGAISLFKQRHRDEIEAMRQGMAAATDHLWISQKANRLAALDTMHSDLQDFKAQRVKDQYRPPTIVPSYDPGEDRSETHGYETLEPKWIGPGDQGREVLMRKFDAALFAAELKVLRDAAEERGEISRELAAAANVLIQNNNSLGVNVFDRASVLALAHKLRLPAPDSYPENLGSTSSPARSNGNKPSDS